MTKVVESLYKVFVYGTLKRGEPNHSWLTKTENGFSRYLCKGRTAQKYPLVIGTRYNIPFLLDKPDIGYQVHGEVYEVDKNMFSQLDVLEDYPKYYDREEQQIITENGILHCWLYLIRTFPEKLLEKKYLESYHSTSDAPYCESYLESTKTDMYDTPEMEANNTLHEKK